MDQEKLKVIASTLRDITPRRHGPGRWTYQRCVDTAGQLLGQALDLGAFDGAKWYMHRASAVVKREQNKHDAVFYILFEAACEIQGTPADLLPNHVNDFEVACPLMADLIEGEACGDAPSKDWLTLKQAGELFCLTRDPDGAMGLVMQKVKANIASQAKPRKDGTAPIATQPGDGQQLYSALDVMKYANDERNKDLDD